MSENQQNEGLNIELNELVAQGVYATGAIINHSPSEFVVDFVHNVWIFSPFGCKVGEKFFR